MPTRLRRAAGTLVFTTLVAAGLLAAGASHTRPVAAQPVGCQFVLGFRDLRALVGPQVVGECVEDQRYAANGNAEQRTTGGLLVWRKADNWTAFTDGNRTWLSGPQGLEVRANTSRFPWEGDAVAMRADRFEPVERVVPVGASLTWVNLDPEEHDIVAADQSFASPLVPPGGAWSFTFARPGTYPYVCTIHRGMEGVVTAVSEPSN
jgi:plastocyanin